MKKYVHKGISLVLVMTMSAWCLAGCESSYTEKKNFGKKEAAEATVSVNRMEALLNSKIGDGVDTEKKETVFVEMNADGTVAKTTVSNVLKVSDKDNISDVSDLDNIKNLKGDEKFTFDNGKLIWENRGEDISYQGTTSKETPVKINVSYYLDGEETAPEQMAGKSGTVKIVYDYMNNSASEGGFVPFIALTGIVLSDNFTNVKVENGKVIDYDDSSIVIGYGAPGFKDSLTAKASKAGELMKDIDIPESFTITADVKDFEMNMALTIATSEIGDMNLEEALDFSDIEGKMAELTDGTNQLEKGAGDLQNGAGELKSGSIKINDGAKDIAKYTADLYLGTTKLLGSYETFNKALINGVQSADKGAQKLYKGTQNVKSASKQLDSGAKSLNSGAKELNSAAAKINEGAGSLSTGLKTAQAAFEDVKDSNGNVKSQGLNNGAKALVQGAKAANAGVKELAGTLQGTPDSIHAQMNDVIKQVGSATGGAISSKNALNQTVEGINAAVNNGMELSAVLQAKGLNTKVYYQLVQAYYSVQTLENVKAAFETQIAGKEAEMKALLEGMTALENGTSSLNTGIGTLYAGIKTLNTGAGTLVSGTGQMAEGTKNLSGGAKSLSDGTGKLKAGADTLNDGMKSLTDGTREMNKKLGKASPQVKAGIRTVDSGAGKISEGAKTLAKGTGTLGSGIANLFDGTKTLKNGVIKLNKDGISKIADIFGNDTKDVIDAVEEILNNGKSYQSFSGINENMTGSVKFVFKTAEIKADK
ncbi:MAG: hypothetical protein HFG29_05860 [Eubacterium sp.]|nr:hypothetical protein [Eubacterium sp.]